MSELRLTGLPPLVSGATRLLILGSFPGAASLARQQYYGHPYNQFWPILEALWPEEVPVQGSIRTLAYEARCQWLLARGLGVWDVYASCERQGSLDAAIRQPVVNDFAARLAQCPSLQAIAHNGGESFSQSRHVRASLQTSGRPDLPMYKLPSTSPANASWRFERKLAAWREVVHSAGLL
jgi:hypoxanthine-DNA glycosylase